MCFLLAPLFKLKGSFAVKNKLVDSPSIHPKDADLRGSLSFYQLSLGVAIVAA